MSIASNLCFQPPCVLRPRPHVHINALTSAVTCPLSRTRPRSRRGAAPTVCAQTPDKPKPTEEDIEASAMTAAASTLILRKAAKSYTKGGTRPSPVVVRESMLQLEKVQRRNKMSIDLDGLLGQWRLVFVTPKDQPTRFNSLFFPLRAHQTFYKFSADRPPPSAASEKTDGDDDDVEVGEFDNGVFLLNKCLYFRVIGPMRFVPNRNRVEFSVDRLKVQAGPLGWKQDGLDKEGYTLKRRVVKDLPFFTFFCVRDDIAVARGRTGGLALYTRVREDEQM